MMLRPQLKQQLKGIKIMALDKAVKDSIIVAAITASGPAGDNAEEWEANVLRSARRITSILSEETNVFAKAIDEIVDSSKFVSLICLVKKETSSTRGVVYFQNIPKVENGQIPALAYTYEQVLAVHTEQAAARAAGARPADLPEGLEAIRTDRTDTIDGLLMAKEATGLVGHRVVVYKINEPIKGGSLKVRVVKQLTDLGRIDSYIVPAAPAVAVEPAA
jgi:hypothetical protein